MLGRTNDHSLSVTYLLQDVGRNSWSSLWN